LTRLLRIKRFVFYRREAMKLRDEEEGADLESAEENPAEK